MNIFITGGTGFIGSALCQTLTKQGHILTILSRYSHTNQQAVTFCQNLANMENFNDFDAVINLAGEPIFDKTWSVLQKQKLVESRLSITQKIVELIQKSDNPPRTLISGSATGYYGDLPFAQSYDEQTACGNAFPAQLCQQWENIALQAQSEKTRVCLIRTGIVLDRKGGALKRMLPLYRLGLGGKLGSGKQHWAWISLNDEIRAILFLLNHAECQGAFNLVAPQLITNAEFNQALAKALHRPAFFHVPEFALKLLLGERAQLLLDNQPLVPQQLQKAGFKFEDQLHDLF
ncbi:MULTISPECIES: TIGR01777 family oxidoreductase [Glaesserella]|uniref:TIGR01777 family protein n=1 Tax=Glaesserella australis TaxID=2094024 RepID=A0A328BYB9_9PAST|nr:MULTISPECIES: TIGR01777 family oxidoreductase [Glaesserella]AUI66161.1 TIGR01777 family protein [Glaesserella sp. 15-184]RAL19183.1 TIGR01777 family protein [Glaesserella australis]